MSETATLQQWICTSCGFIYDPEQGDPDGGIPAGTAFEDIPNDWFCPVCGARKKDFELLESYLGPGCVLVAGLAQHGVRHGDLSDVVQHACDPDPFDAPGVSSSSRASRRSPATSGG